MKRTIQATIRSKQSGLTLIELMIAMMVLAIGLTGIMAIVIAALYSNNHNRTDTSATWLAVMVIQQMGEIPAGTDTTFSITDCAGTAWNVHTSAGGTAAGSNAGAAQRGTNNAPGWVTNDINFSVPSNAVNAAGAPLAPGDGYHMMYRACGTNGSNGILYDVRWHITRDIEQTKTVIVGAKILGTGSGEQNYYFSFPVQMKTILGT